MELQARAFPSLGKKAETGNNQQNDDMDRGDNFDANEETNEQVLPISPVEERDAKIINLKKELEKLQGEVKELPQGHVQAQQVSQVSTYPVMAPLSIYLTDPV